jgi:tetratricopeptide (TPR) repeat protein
VIDDLHELRSAARSALARNDVDGALASLMEAATQTHVAEDEYAPIARMLGDALAMKGDLRGALTARWCVAMSDESSWGQAVSMAAHVPPVDRARTLAARKDMGGAARAMEDAGLPAQAAIYRESARDWRGARALWSRLAQVVARGRDAGQDAYNAALVHFNLGRCALELQDARGAREAFVAAVRLLEEAADELEARGLRERAFDCFHVLVEIGRAGKQFEHVLEGYINCIRILREDHLKYFALQFYDEALGAAKEAGELAAAATIAREAADYARSLGMDATSAHYVIDQAESWRGAAKLHEQRGAPPEIAENSLLAAIQAYGQLGKFARVGSLYVALSTMELEASRKAHYARAARRYEGVKDEEVAAAPIPPHMRRDAHVVPVWHVDLVEWEQRGSAAEACADVLLDDRWTEPIRRRAMLARLTALRVESGDDRSPKASEPHARVERGSGRTDTEGRVKLAEELAQLALYAVLSPLEAMFARPEKPVRLAVLASLEALHFKRTFVTIQEAIRDADPQIVAQAAKSIEELVFPHAFDPLARIVRESEHANVRASALKALARIDSPAAAELLLGVLDHGAPADREAAARALREWPSTAFVEAARAAMAGASAAQQAVIREVLRAAEGRQGRARVA